MQWTEATATKRLEELKMSDMPVTPINPRTVRVSPDWFQRYKELCHTFTKSLSDCVQDGARNSGQFIHTISHTTDMGR